MELFPSSVRNSNMLVPTPISKLTPSTPSKNKQSLTRFSRIYQDPIELLRNLLDDKISLYHICQKCLKGQISSEFRSILYKIFLNILPYNQPEQWLSYTNESRARYETTLENLLSQNENILPFIKCEASKGTEIYDSFATLIPKDFDLLSLIKLDVDRTFQELFLYHSPSIKEILCKILFVYSKVNTDPSYCQGMNEILGTLLYATLPSLTITNSPIECTREKGEESKKAEIYYKELTSDKHFEADLFALYEELMSRDLKELYTYNDARYRGKNMTFDKNNITLEQIENSEESDLGKRIKKIFYVYLKIYDEELFDFLVQQIEPDVFLFRWILCMLNREISLRNVIWIWDCILAYEFIEFTINTIEVDKTRVNFLDYMCLAMIINLKPKLFNGDEGGMLLMNFLQYPNEQNLKEIIAEAKKIGTELNNKVNLWDDKKLK